MAAAIPAGVAPRTTRSKRFKLGRLSERKGDAERGRKGDAAHCFRGLPRGRSVCSSCSRAADCVTKRCPPKGVPLRTELQSGVNSASDCARLTCATYWRGRAMGHSLRICCCSGVPCFRRQRLPYLQSSARSHSEARTRVDGRRAGGLGWRVWSPADCSTAARYGCETRGT